MGRATRGMKREIHPPSPTRLLSYLSGHEYFGATALLGDLRKMRWLRGDRLP
jgi:hypothetical protein